MGAVGGCNTAECSLLRCPHALCDAEAPKKRSFSILFFQPYSVVCVAYIGVPQWDTPSPLPLQLLRSVGGVGYGVSSGV